MTEKSEQDARVERVWREYLTTGGHEKEQRQRKLFRLLPANPSQARCRNCYAPFQGLGAPLVRILYNKRPSNLNPHFCQVCEEFAREHQGGAEIEMSMLFADIRGSTTLAEGMSPTEFSQLIDRFYTQATDVLVESDAFIDKLAGDQVAAFFVPATGADHAARAIEAARNLLRVTGHEDSEGPWVPVGAGVHTGIAFVGAVGTAEGVIDITALGDSVNTAARIASKAGTGEILVSEAAMARAGLKTDSYEERELDLKGKSETISARVLNATSALSR